MTPEEKAVIEAAITWRESFVHKDAAMIGAGPIADAALAKVIDALIFSCPQCNAGGHTCPGDGEPIGHTATDCGQHEHTPPTGRGPDGSAWPCFECLTDETEDPAPWCDCASDETCKGPCRRRAHIPDRCPNKPNRRDEPMTPENKERIRLNLIDYITGTVDEWLRMAHFDQTPEDKDGIQYRISWEHPTEGAMIANIKETQYSEPLARFGVQVIVDALPDLPPIGPENDPAMTHEECCCDPAQPVYCHAQDCRGGSTYVPPDKGAWLQPEPPSEIEVPVEDLIAQNTGIETCEICTGIGCGRCNNVGQWRNSFKAVRVKEDDPVWVPAVFLLCLAGDRIRIGNQETDVIRCNSGIWHADNSDYWQPKTWPHAELRMDLAANPGFREYPPQTPCEILCTPERRAVLEVMRAFPGTQRVDGSPVQK